jgi:hypothetical protein
MPAYNTFRCHLVLPYCEKWSRHVSLEETLSLSFPSIYGLFTAGHVSVMSPTDVTQVQGNFTCSWPFLILKQDFLGRTNRLLCLIRHGPHWKRRAQHFFYCVCMRYRGNVSTEPLPSNDRGFLTEPLPINDTGIFTKPFHRNYGEGGWTHRHTHTQQRDLISLLSLFKIRKLG